MTEGNLGDSQRLKHMCSISRCWPPQIRDRGVGQGAIELVPSWIQFHEPVLSRGGLKDSSRAGANVLGGVLHSVNGTVVKRPRIDGSLVGLETRCGIEGVWHIVSFLCRDALEWRIIRLVLGLHGWVHTIDLPRLVVHIVVSHTIKLTGVHHTPWWWLDSSMPLQWVLLVGEAMCGVGVDITLWLLVLVRLVVEGPLRWPLAIVILLGGDIIQRNVGGDWTPFRLEGLGPVASLSTIVPHEGGQAIHGNACRLVLFALLLELGTQWVAHIIITVTSAVIKRP